MFDRISERRPELAAALREQAEVMSVGDVDRDRLLVTYTNEWDAMPSSVSETAGAYGYVPTGALPGATRLMPIEDASAWER